MLNVHVCYTREMYTNIRKDIEGYSKENFSKGIKENDLTYIRSVFGHKL